VKSQIANADIFASVYYKMSCCGIYVVYVWFISYVRWC